MPLQISITLSHSLELSSCLPTKSDLSACQLKVRRISAGAFRGCRGRASSILAFPGASFIRNTCTSASGAKGDIVMGPHRQCNLLHLPEPYIVRGKKSRCIEVWVDRPSWIDGHTPPDSRRSHLEGVTSIMSRAVGDMCGFGIGHLS